MSIKIVSFNFGENFFEVKTLLFTISALPDFRTPFYTKRTEKRQKGQISRKKSRNTCAQFLFLKKNFWKNLSNDKKIKYQVSHQVLTVIDQKMCKFHGRRKNSWKFVYILTKQCRFHFNLTNFLSKNFQNSQNSNFGTPKPWKFVYILAKQCRPHINLTSFFLSKNFKIKRFRGILKLF